MQDLQQIKEKMQAAERELNRLEGRKEQLLSTLHEFGCSNMEEAEAKLEEMTDEYDKKKEQFEKDKQAFIQKYELGDG